VRAIDRAAGTLELWVTTGSSGPGAAWALACAPGDTFEAVGPRGKVRVDDTVPSHLLVVDTSGLSAALAMQAAIHPPSTVSVAALVERVPGAAALRGLAVHAQPAPAFLTSLDDLVGHLERLLGADRGTDPGADPRSTAAYVFGELSFTRLVRDRLVELGIPGARVAAKAYWRAGQSNQDHGEPDKTPA
jgi:NADPH-dependent ferric siderophore reductase